MIRGYKGKKDSTKGRSKGTWRVGILSKRTTCKSINRVAQNEGEVDRVK